MDEQVERALETDQVIDITTRGRRSGKAYRIEIWFHRVEGKLYITGTPGRRSWYANLLAHPEFTFHLKESVRADLPAEARPILAEPERRQVLKRILDDLGDRVGEHTALETWVAKSPLVEVRFRE